MRLENSIATYEKIQQIAADIIKKQIFNRGEDKKLLQEFIKLVHGFRYYMISNTVFAEDVWSFIRANESLTDMVLASTADFRAQVCKNTSDWEMVVERMASAYALRPEDEEDAVIDSDTLGMLASSSELIPILEANGWLVFILVVHGLDIREFSEVGE